MYCSAKYYSTLHKTSQEIFERGLRPNGYFPLKRQPLGSVSLLTLYFDLFRVLHRSADRQNADARFRDPSSGLRILRISCGRYRDPSRCKRELTGCLVIGVIGICSQLRSVHTYRQIRKDRIERVVDDCVVCSGYCSVSGILDRERIGQCSVFGNGLRRDRFVNAQCRALCCC